MGTAKLAAVALVPAALSLCLCIAAARGEASAATIHGCHGSAHARHGVVRFSFSCGAEASISSFRVSTNLPLANVYEPESVFGCERSSARSFACEDEHSGIPGEGAGRIKLRGPICPPGHPLRVQIRASNPEEGRSKPFTLKGPCPVH